MASTLTTVKDLLKEAFKFSGTLGENDELDGGRAQTGLYYLNQLITSANMQVFLPFAQVIKDIPQGFQVYLLTSDPALVSNQEEIPEAVKPWGPAKIIEAPQPKIINSLAYKIGIQYTPITPIGTPSMVKYAISVKATPEFFSYEEYPTYTAIFLNRPTAFPLRAVYSRSIELADMDGRLDVPMQYTEYLMFGLAYRLAVKYQQPVESIAGVKTLFNEAEANIKELVKNDHSITWGDTGNMADGWFPGAVMCPPGWC